MTRFVAVGGSGVGLRFAVDRHPGAGETLLASGMSIINGGKASNHAIGAATLGADAWIVTAVGSDTFATIARALWTSYGVRQDGVVVDPREPTMVGAVVVDPSGENRILVAPGALARLDAAAMEPFEALIQDADVCVVSLEIPVAAATAALAMARAAGVLTVLNPAPAPADRGDISGLLALADWVTPNETEATLLTGLDDPAEAAAALLSAGPKGAAMTLGARGVLLADGSATRVHASPAVERLVDTSGAGDAFTTAFALGLACGASPDEAAGLGTEAGSLICGGPGFVEALDQWDVLRARFAGLLG